MGEEREGAGRNLPQWCGLNLIAGNTTPLLLLRRGSILASTVAFSTHLLDNLPHVPLFV